MKKTYDVVFSTWSGDKRMGWKKTLRECEEWIDENNGTFDYDDDEVAYVRIICNETNRIVRSEEAYHD